MKGFFNRILRIDLANRRFGYEDLPDAVLQRTLGGKGLGTHLLLTEDPPGVAPLAAEAVLVLAGGPLTGTRIWGRSRFAAFAKSPATRGFAESYCGGTAPRRVTGCGVDAIVLTGASDRMVWLKVDQEGVTFEDASEMREWETHRTEEHVLRRSAEDARAVTIGPAGENLVRFACIKSDRWRSLGRTGLGAVLGSKRVKAMTFAGSASAPVADETLLREINRCVAAKGKAAPATQAYRTKGTPQQVAVTNLQNCFPTRYWSSGRFERWRELSADYMNTHFEVNNHGCPDCFLQCTKRSRLREGRHAGLELEGPEYETIYAIGGLNCVAPLEEVAYLNDLCDRLGMDTMTAGNVSAFAVEAHRAGASDFAIDYGQPDRMADLFGMIARREGVGAVLADGVKAASEAWGLEDLAVHAKGLEPAGFDPRVLKGMGLSYATAARGACHLRGTFYKAELTGEIDPAASHGKAARHIDYEDRACLSDCLILCRFFRDFCLWDEIGALIRGATGLDWDKSALESFANRVTLSTREYNRREGLGPESDRLPAALLKANAEGASITIAELQLMIHEYNAIRTSRAGG